MKQLVMVRLNAPYVERPLPNGYCYCGYHECEAEKSEWKRIVFEGADTPADEQESLYRMLIPDYPDLVPDNDVFFICDPNGKRIATTTVVKHADNSGYVHMVQCTSDCRGKGLGHCLITHAIRLLDERDVTYMLLTTDDFRLPAIKTYLDAGFRPVLVDDADSDMLARWSAVLENLNYWKVDFLSEKDYIKKEI